MDYIIGISKNKECLKEYNFNNKTHQSIVVRYCEKIEILFLQSYLELLEFSWQSKNLK